MKSYIKSNFFTRWWRFIDQELVIVVIILLYLNLMLVNTASVFLTFKKSLSKDFFLKKQALFQIISIFNIILFSSLRKSIIRIISILGFLLNILLLLLIKFLGHKVKGATRWFIILGFSVQPSEFIKPLFAVVIGWLLSLKDKNIEYNLIIYICFIIYMILIILLSMQPDFGLILLITISFVIQLFVSGLALKYFFIIFILQFILISVVIYINPYIYLRLSSFYFQDFNKNYQVLQSLLCFKQGGLYGIGPGEGLVKYYLPDAHTDFIFAVLGEEFGLYSCLMIIFLFMFIIFRILLFLINERNKFIQFSLLGLISQFALQVIINIAVNINVVPTKGITLPFISYGGSSIVSLSIAFGIMLSFIKKKPLLNNHRKFLILNIENRL